MSLLQRSSSRLTGRQMACLWNKQFFSYGRGMSSGFFKEFADKVKQEVEKNPELKGSVEELRKRADSIKERSDSFKQQAGERLKGYQESAEQLSARSKEAAGKFSEQHKQFTEQATKVTSTFTDQFSKATEQMKSAFGDGFLGSKNTSGETATEREEGAPQGGAAAGDGSASAGKAGTSTLSSRARGILSTVAREVRDVFSPPEQVSSATYRPAAAQAPEGDSGPTELVAVAPQKTAFEKQYERFKSTIGQTPLFQQLYSQVEKAKETPVAKSLSERASKVRERVSNLREDLHERWETSDSAVVHSIQHFQDSMFAESERASAMRVIRQRDPNFDMVRFLLGVRQDIPVLLKAYLTGDTEVLKQTCSKEMVERLSGQHKFLTQEGQVIDSTILDTGEIELIDVKVLEGHPLIVVRFSAQQINCTRDRFGNVVEGAPDDVQRVYYLWALQQDEQGIVDEAGKYWAPRWQLREMLVQGMHNLL